MKQTLPFFGSSPKRNEAPEYPVPGRQLLHNHLETQVTQDGNEFVVSYRDKRLFPSAVAMPALPFVRLECALHCAAQFQDFRRAAQVFKAHELVLPAPASIPGFEQQVPKSFGREGHMPFEVRAMD